MLKKVGQRWKLKESTTSSKIEAIFDDVDINDDTRMRGKVVQTNCISYKLNDIRTCINLPATECFNSYWEYLEGQDASLDA